jgi:hypothetical protein
MILGGTSVIFAKKTGNLNYKIDRPKIRAISPDRLVIDENYLLDPRLDRFVEILEEVQRHISLRSE